MATMDVRASCWRRSNHWGAVCLWEARRALHFSLVARRCGMTFEDNGWWYALIAIAVVWCPMVIIGWAQKRRERRQRVAKNLYDLLDALDADRDAALSGIKREAYEKARERSAQ